MWSVVNTYYRCVAFTDEDMPMLSTSSPCKHVYYRGGQFHLYPDVY